VEPLKPFQELPFYQPKNAIIANRTITNASNFMLSSFVQEMKVLNFLPIASVLSGIAEAF